MKLRVLVAAVIATLLALGLAACGSNNNKKTSSTSTPAMAANTPSIAIVSPTAGATESGTVTATVNVKNFKIAPDQVGKAAVKGEGHLHFSMDNGKYDHPKYSGANGKLAKQLGVDGKYSPSVAPTVVYKGLPSGPHTLTVYEANNDHSETGTKATVNFQVK